MDLRLLPAADEIVNCADHARALAVDPGGSAMNADVLIAVEVPLPWPKPVFDHPLLQGLDVAAAAAPVPARVLAAVPLDPVAPGSSVVTYRRQGAALVRAEIRVASEQVGETVRAALSEPAAVGEPSVGPTDHPPEVWICTQGSHDSCCGRDGTRLAMELVARGGDVVVRRVSHTGGHRFAPTALTLPDGRLWGYLDPDGVAGIITRRGDPTQLAPRCRGWVGAPTGVAQVAERAVFADVGWDLDDAHREIEVLDGSGDGASVSVQARWSDGRAVRYRVEVTTVRDVPTIACRAPGGLPAKPGREFGVTHCVRLD